MSEPHLCPVCGKHQFTDYGSFGICPVCDWLDDPVYVAEPDFNGGAYKYSLNEARARWQEKQRKVKP